MGKAYLYYGNGGAGVALRPRQMRSDGSAHIAPLGMSDSETTVQLRLTGRMPLGREKVRLQWQVTLLGTPFTATSVISGVSAAWTDTLTTGAVITQNVTGLTAGAPYHWRVRLLYRPGNPLGQPASRWLTIPWNGWTEQDFRTVPMTNCFAQLGSNPTVTYSSADAQAVRQAVDAAVDGDTVKVAGYCAGVETRAGLTQLTPSPPTPPTTAAGCS
jgi:hypothetical protein